MKYAPGWLFITPWIVGLLLFYLYPLVSSIFLSFTSYSILKAGQFVGLQNYQSLMQDKVFWSSIYNTVYYALVFVPLSIILSTGLALLLNTRVRGIAIYRTLFYLPTLVPLVASSELQQAARIDWAGEFHIYWRIMLPLAMPAVLGDRVVPGLE
ncbi:carbohydrate ABC transporter permease [Paenibacillus andongensis]|uniref:carbohydrate ABC transporter permease n=1 Tax=Paenibacillus andongensis TaxID=2975482 RepID=UPI0034637A23